MGQQNDHLNKKQTGKSRLSGAVENQTFCDLNHTLNSSFSSSSFSPSNYSTSSSTSSSLSSSALLLLPFETLKLPAKKNSCELNTNVSSNLPAKPNVHCLQKYQTFNKRNSHEAQTNGLIKNGLKALQDNQMLRFNPSSQKLSNLQSQNHSKSKHQSEVITSSATKLKTLCRSILNKMGIFHFDLINHNYNNIKYKSQSTSKTGVQQKSHCSIYNGVIIGNGRPYPTHEELYEEPPYHIALMCYLSYVVLICFGYFQDFLRTVGISKNHGVERNRDGYPRLYKNFESFYTRNIYRRIRDAFNRPISSVPGAYINVVDRVSKDHNWTFQHPGTTSRVLNMGSYNYLGFAENSGPIHEKVIEILQSKSVGVGSTRNELGSSDELSELESLMADYLGVEASIVIGMGFATNSTNIRCLATKGCLIISDSLNHASLCLGCRLSGATIRTFKHNDVKDLERKIRRAIIEGQPRSHRPWRKIILLVEGIYSMEGTIVNLPELIKLKKLYKCYLYVDEAHSIGALGSNGRGVVDFYGCNPQDVDIHMGTFTKSFGAAGGYIAGRRQLVEHIRRASYSTYYATAMSPVVAKQISSVVWALMNTDDGRQRIEQLARNTHYFRQKLKQNGFIILGNDDSPVVPLMLCFCPAIACVIRLAFERGLGFIGAGFPATSLTTGRVRFCISAAHTKSMLDESLQVMNEIGDKIGVKYSRREINLDPIEY